MLHPCGGESRQCRSLFLRGGQIAGPYTCRRGIRAGPLGRQGSDSAGPGILARESFKKKSGSQRIGRSHASDSRGKRFFLQIIGECRRPLSGSFRG